MRSRAAAVRSLPAAGPAAPLAVALAVALAAALAVSPGPAWGAGEGAGQPADSDTTQTPPSTGGGGLGDAVQRAQQQTQAGDDSTAAEETLAPTGWILSWETTPEVGMRADVKSVRWRSTVGSTIAMRGSLLLDASGSYQTEEYRKQDKTVEGRSGNVHFADAGSRWFRTDLNLTQDWSEDRTVSSFGSANIIKRDYKNATLAIDSLKVRTGAVQHRVRLDGTWNGQQGSTLGQRNDFSEANGKVAMRSRYRAAPGVRLLTTLYGERTSGERTLGSETSPSASHGDTVAGRVFYARGLGKGSFSAVRSNFAKEYLDYRRNVNGIIDTLGAGEKILQELERNDAVSLEWKHTVTRRGVTLATNLKRNVSEDTFRESTAGRKERHADHVDLAVGFRTRADSLSVAYNYDWNWDDQRYRGATASRGRQVMRRRGLDLNWRRDLFRSTDLQVQASHSLQQDIAVGRFNDNDRDRLETGLNALVESNLSGFKARMSFVAKRVEEIAIRATRSSNNSVKDSYELRPSYYYPLAGWLILQQGFNISIQYTDYVFSDLPSVSQRDDYNKRGNLKTQVTIRATDKLKLDLSHDYNSRFNATRSSSDASGRDFYSRDLTQRISEVELVVTYLVAEGLTLEGATERTKDLKTTYSPRVSEQDRRGGEVWVGFAYKKHWGDEQSRRELTAKLRKYNAHGPNVQPAYADYWDADVSFSWRF